MTELVAEYAIGQPVTCRLLHRGLNDTYLVTTAEVRYVLRVYRYPEASALEIDLLFVEQQYGLALANRLRDALMPSAGEQDR